MEALGSVETIKLGKDRLEYFVELGKYPASGQPRLLLAPYARVEPKVTFTFEYGAFDLRAYDADFAFKRVHALIRCSGEFHRLWEELMGWGLLKPCAQVLSDGSHAARVCQIELSLCTVIPQEDGSDDFRPVPGSGR